MRFVDWLRRRAGDSAESGEPEHEDETAEEGDSPADGDRLEDDEDDPTTYPLW